MRASESFVQELMSTRIFNYAIQALVGVRLAEKLHDWRTLEPIGSLSFGSEEI